MHPVQDYFLTIAQEYQQILESIAPSWSSIAKLQQTCSVYEQVAIARFKNIDSPTHFIARIDRSVGLNSVGLLLDRLSILSIKVWCLQNTDKDRDRSKATQLCQDQILDVTGALSEAIPAQNFLNSKITIYQTSVTVNEWESAIYHLLVTNLLIWKAQEALYCRSSTEADRQFRTYMSLFPEINLRRDEFIHRCEHLYWSIFQIEGKKEFS